MEKKQIIEAMHNRLHEIDPHAKAILFGSRARGTEHEGSDWDVLVLLDKPKVTLQDYDKYSYPLRELGWDIDEIINPVLFSQKEWEENHYTLFNHNVRKELQYDEGSYKFYCTTAGLQAHNTCCASA